MTARSTSDPLIVSRFDVAMEPAIEEEQILVIGATAQDGQPVALLLDPETRAKVAGWLAPEPAAELVALRERYDQLDRMSDQVMAERDAYHDTLDLFALAVAPEEVIGEHSSGNNPWANAFELVTPAAEVDALRARVAELETSIAPRLCVCGHSRHAHTVPAPYSCFAFGRTCPCPTYRQLLPDEAWEQQRKNIAASKARAAVASPEDPHDGPLHHDYTLGRDLPEVTPGDLAEQRHLLYDADPDSTVPPLVDIHHHKTTRRGNR